MLRNRYSHCSGIAIRFNLESLFYLVRKMQRNHIGLATASDAATRCVFVVVATMAMFTVLQIALPKDGAKAYEELVQFIKIRIKED